MLSRTQALWRQPSVRPAAVIAAVRDLTDETDRAPSTGDVAARLDVHPKTAQRALNELLAAGQLVADGSPGHRRWALPEPLTAREEMIATTARLTRRMEGDAEARAQLSALLRMLDAGDLVAVVGGAA